MPVDTETKVALCREDIVSMHTGSTRVHSLRDCTFCQLYSLPAEFLRRVEFGEPYSSILECFAMQTKRVQVMPLM